MKRLILSILVISTILTVYGQENCRVLVPSLVGKYTGDCKDGLASGNGEATGVDFYSGEFAKGLPNGKGRYIWKDGSTYEGQWKKGLRDGNGIYVSKHAGRDSVQNGIWKEDHFVGEKRIEPYVIEYKNGIARVTCMRIGDRPYIKYKFQQSGLEANIVSGLLLQGSSGTERNNPEFTGFESVTFPFSGKLTFTAPNTFRTAMINCEIRFRVNEPGSWLVTIFL
jgi:hypothetical protein